MGWRYKAFCRNNGWIKENMDKGLTVPKWVLIVWPKIHQMPQNLSAQFVFPSPKFLDFNEKSLHWVSVVCGFNDLFLKLSLNCRWDKKFDIIPWNSWDIKLEMRFCKDFGPKIRGATLRFFQPERSILIVIALSSCSCDWD